jgi:chromate transporter
LILSVALKMGRPLRRLPVPIAFAASTFVAIALFRMPLLWTLAVIAPLSIGIAWWRSS